MQLLKQSTAVAVLVGPLLDPFGVEFHGAVVADFSVAKNGGALAPMASPATVAHDDNGIYRIGLTADITNTLGRLDIACNRDGYQCPIKELTVVVDPNDVCEAVSHALPWGAPSGGTFPSHMVRHFALLMRCRGIAAQLKRGNATATLPVLMARTDSQAVTSREARFEAELQDIIVKVSDYKADNDVVVPATGDTITANVAGMLTTFEVRPASETDEVARHTDPTRQFWRLSTKVMGRVAL